MNNTCVKTLLGAAVSLVWFLLIQGETDPKDYIREITAWCGGFLIGGGLLSADDFFRKLWYKEGG